MSFLGLLSYVSFMVQICVVTVSIAAGLYYLAELVEEYTVIAKKIISWMVVVSVLLYVVFIFTERFSWTMLVCGLGAQVLHAVILKNFPFVKFLSPSFLGAVALLLVNHYLAFVYFQWQYHPFSEVMAYFTLCLWLVPFALFVSLSANDNVLPTSNERTPLLGDDIVTNYFSSRKKLGLLSLFNYAKESLLPERNKKSF
ncbi:protein TEX261 isoform X1 [Toxorhynchites rutilus septentrionalis]|uniref:protein TEX261 isoform X1 n=1 Tax=Toxorhynchites rutilus septentrionalis TaxID=329112 RepID=UPI0024785405|nr:protein TEX261 isoform X1 [Toxorhynchites rutilus septentrionalis]